MTETEQTLVLRSRELLYALSQFHDSPTREKRRALDRASERLATAIRDVQNRKDETLFEEDA